LSGIRRHLRCAQRHSQHSFATSAMTFMSLALWRWIRLWRDPPSVANCGSIGVACDCSRSVRRALKGPRAKLIRGVFRDVWCDRCGRGFRGVSNRRAAHRQTTHPVRVAQAPRRAWRGARRCVRQPGRTTRAWPQLSRRRCLRLASTALQPGACPSPHRLRANRLAKMGSQSPAPPRRGAAAHHRRLCASAGGRHPGHHKQTSRKVFARVSLRMTRRCGKPRKSEG